MIWCCNIWFGFNLIFDLIYLIDTWFEFISFYVMMWNIFLVFLIDLYNCMIRLVGFANNILKYGLINVIGELKKPNNNNNKKLKIIFSDWWICKSYILVREALACW